MMNKARVEALSDGIFSIVMTLLVFDIKVPFVASPLTEAGLLSGLASVWPHIVVFIGIFIILSVSWINHHFLFHFYAREVDRWLNLTNLFYLMCIVFIPFSASFLAAYPGYQISALLFGANLLASAVLSIAMFKRIIRTQGAPEHASRRLLRQSGIRGGLNVACYTLGILVSFFSPYLCLVLFIFPVIFNIIPGTLDLSERIFGFDLDA